MPKGFDPTTLETPNPLIGMFLDCRMPHGKRIRSHNPGGVPLHKANSGTMPLLYTIKEINASPIYFNDSAYFLIH